MKLARGKAGYSGGLAKGKRFRVAGSRGQVRARKRTVPVTVSIESPVEKIIGRAAILAGSREDAASWYETQLIPSLGYRTPRALVADGLGDAVIRYLAALEEGGYA